MKRLAPFALALALLACQESPSTVRPLFNTPKKSSLVATTPRPTATPTPGPDATPTPTPAPTATPTATPTPTSGGGGSSSSHQLGLTVGAQLADSWVPGPSLVRPRAGLAGGVAGSALLALEGEGRPSTEVYSPDQAGWRLVSSYDVNQPTLPPLYMVGGRTLMTAGQGAAAMMVAGGHSSAGGASGDALTYDATGYTGAVASYASNFEAAAGGLVRGMMVAAGGIEPDGEATSACRLLHVELNKETAGAIMPVAVAGAASVVYNNKLYVFGGYTLDGAGKPVAQKVVQVFDPDANRWRRDGDGQAGAPAALPAAVHSAAACVLGTKVVLAGGVDVNGGVLADVRLYDLASNTWSAGLAMPTPRALLALVPYQGRAWAIGGFGAGRQALTTVEIYRP